MYMEKQVVRADPSLPIYIYIYILDVKYIYILDVK